MNRAQFDHALRAAAAVLGEREVLVIGSQALHGSFDAGLPPEAERSVEVDLLPLDDDSEAKADLIDGSIGEASPFHEAFGYYAQGVGPRTAVLPQGWRERLVRYEEPVSGTIGWCLEPHDLWISKAIAGRPKDDAFCASVLRASIVDPVVLAERLAAVDGLDAPVQERVTAWIARGQV